jgi:hypothetical protein
VRFRLRERGEGATSPDHGIDIAKARLNSADRIVAHKHDRAARMALLAASANNRFPLSSAHHLFGCVPSDAHADLIACSTLGAMLGGKSVKHGKDRATDRMIG